MSIPQAETHLLFPPSASVEQLKLIRESIAAERDQRLRGVRPTSAAGHTSSPQGHASTSQASPSQPSSVVIMFFLPAGLVLLTSSSQCHTQHLKINSHPSLTLNVAQTGGSLLILEHQSETATVSFVLG